MGSRSDWPTLQAAAQILDELGVSYEVLQIVSAHRAPDRLYDDAKCSAIARDAKAIIAGAEGGRPIFRA